MSETMKALVYHGPNNYGLEDVPMPRLEKDTDVIGRVSLSTICTSDVHIVGGHIPIVKPGRILGHEFCVELVEVGSAVKGFKVGDHVHVAPLSFCGACAQCRVGRVGYCENGGGFGIIQNGCQAEYIRIPDANSCMIPIPAGLTERDVLLLGDMMATGWFGIKNAHVQEGQTVAVVGVGPVGLSTCALLKKAFKARVIAMDLIPARVDLALKNGVADEGVYVNLNDPLNTEKVMALTGGRGVDAVIETGGTSDSLNLSLAIPRYEGVVSLLSVFAAPITIPMQEVYKKNLEIRMGVQKCEGIPEMLKLIASGVVDTKFILTHESPLNDIMRGYEVFGKKQDGCVKWVITPYVR